MAFNPLAYTNPRSITTTWSSNYWLIRSSLRRMSGIFLQSSSFASKRVFSFLIKFWKNLKSDLEEENRFVLEVDGGHQREEVGFEVRLSLDALDRGNLHRASACIKNN